MHQNTSSGILADKRPEKLVPPAFPALQSPIISSLSVCLPSSARFTLCPPPWWPGHRKCQRGFGSFVPASASTAKKHAMSSNILLLSFWVLNDVPGCYKIQKVKNSLADFRMQIPWLRLLIPLFIYIQKMKHVKSVYTQQMCRSSAWFGKSEHLCGWWVAWLVFTCGTVGI